jgi:hypothetical protein
MFDHSFSFLRTPFSTFQDSLLIHSLFDRHAVTFSPTSHNEIVLFRIGRELKSIVSIVVDLASTLDPDGVDVYFLNREPLYNVRSSAELDIMFAMEPEGTVEIIFFRFRHRVRSVNRSNADCTCAATSPARQTESDSRTKAAHSSSYGWSANG